MNLNNIFEFLIDLRFNNNRPWFKENSQRFQSTKTVFEEFINLLILEVKKIDNSIDDIKAKDCIYRIYRDVRFSKNKEPYKTSYGAFVSKGGKNSKYAGYYIHFEPDSSLICCGVYQPNPILLKAIRTEIYNNPSEYKKILSLIKNNGYFTDFYGDRLKSAPRGFSKNFTDIDLLKNKHFVIAYKIDNDFWFKENHRERIIEIIKTQKLYADYINQIVDKIERI